MNIGLSEIYIFNQTKLIFITMNRNHLHYYKQKIIALLSVFSNLRSIPRIVKKSSQKQSEMHIHIFIFNP